MTMRKVNKKSQVPLYYQLKNIIREKIELNEWKPREKILSLPEMSRYHKISQMTVRHSITELSEEGLIYSIRGKGTFVAKPKIERDLSSLTYFTEHIKKTGLNILTKLIRSEKSEAPQDVADALMIPMGTPVIQVHRLREIDDEPFYIEMCYFPYEPCKSLLEKDLSQHSLHFLIENHLGYSIDHAIMSIEAIGANGYQSKFIKVKKGTPLLLIKQTTYLIDDQPIQFVEAASRSDKFKYSLMRRKKK